MDMSVSGSGIFWSDLKIGTASATFHSFDTEAVWSKKLHDKIRRSAALFLAFLQGPTQLKQLLLLYAITYSVTLALDFAGH